jgi:thiamine-phosphate pyrophosphorylase
MDFNFGIYPVITDEFCGGRSIIYVLRQVVEAGVKIVQLRQKNSTKKELYLLALEFRKITGYHGVKLIINDHLDIAIASGADGVHLGQDDLPCAAARALAPDIIIGVSTHNEKEIACAKRDGATYANIGPVFETNTKDLPMKPLGLEYVYRVSPKIGMPFTVMGGIKKENIASLAWCGAAAIAMVTEITAAPDIKKRIEELNDILRAGRFGDILPHHTVID